MIHKIVSLVPPPRLQTSIPNPYSPQLHCSSEMRKFLKKALRPFIGAISASDFRESERLAPIVLGAQEGTQPKTSPSLQKSTSSSSASS